MPRQLVARTRAQYQQTQHGRYGVIGRYHHLGGREPLFVTAVVGRDHVGSERRRQVIVLETPAVQVAQRCRRYWTNIEVHPGAVVARQVIRDRADRFPDLGRRISLERLLALYQVRLQIQEHALQVGVAVWNHVPELSSALDR